MLQWWGNKNENNQPEIHSQEGQSVVTVLGQPEEQQQQRATIALRAASFSAPPPVSQTELSSSSLAESEKQSKAQVSSFSSYTKTALPPPDVSSSVSSIDQNSEKQAFSSLKQQSPQGKSPASPLATWNDALYRACVAHETFMRTPAQVLQEQQQVLRPRFDSVVVVYENNIEKTSKAIVEEMNQTVPLSSSQQPTTTLARRFVSNLAWGAASSAVWVGSKLLQTVVGDEDDYDENELTYSEQADDVNESVQPVVGWSVPVVCVEYVTQCVNQLLPHCDDKMLALSRQGTGNYSFAGWAANTCHLCKNVKASDLDLLMHVFVQAGHAIFYGNYIVFDKSATETELQVATSLAQLKQAIQDTEDRIEEWTRQADKYTGLALRKNQKGDQKGAAHEFRKVKLLRTKIESARGSLLNLHQTHDTLETSQLHHTQVLKPLEAAASALKVLREVYPVEKVDKVALDLQEELGELNVVTTEALFDGKVHDEDEDRELMKGLNGLDEDHDLMEELDRLKVEDGEKESEAKEYSVKSPPRIDETKNEDNSLEVDLPAAGATKRAEKERAAVPA